MSENRTDSMQIIKTVASWAAYAATIVKTANPVKAEFARDLVTSLGSSVSESEKQYSISHRVDEYCRAAWVQAVEKNAYPEKRREAILSMKEELCAYNFASNPWEWDRFSEIKSEVVKVCRKAGIPSAERSSISGRIARDAVLLLGSRMDDDPTLMVMDKLNSVDTKLDSLRDMVKNQPGKGSSKTVPEGGEFSLSHSGIPFCGREDEIRTVLDWIGKYNIILVHGEGGIGKTEFCREVLKRTDKPFTAASLIECRDFMQMIRRIAGVMDIAVSDEDTETIIERQVLAGLKGILYLDNFEDILSENKTAVKDRRRTLEFLRRCTQTENLTVLISSRYRPVTDISIQTFLLDVLDEKAAVTLFIGIWGEVPDEEIRDFVVDELHCYPLTIVLTAKQKEYVSDISELKRVWQKARVPGMGNTRHESLETAINITFDEIREDEKARYLWELFTLFPDKISVEESLKIIPESFEARSKLIDLSIIHLDNGMLFMQPILRKFIERTDEYKKDILILNEMVMRFYHSVYDVDRPIEIGSDQDVYAVKSIHNALYFMNKQIECENGEAVSTIHILLCDFYNALPFESVEIVKRAVDTISFEDKLIAANIRRCCGELECRTDQLIEAEKHFKESEELFREIGNELGLANVLRSLGKLEEINDHLKEADNYYTEAKYLYSKIGDNLGLANVLNSIGDKEKYLYHLTEAEKCYNEAEDLYRSIGVNLGLANVFKSKGDLEILKNQPKEAEVYYIKAKELYSSIGSSLGYANVLQSIGNLELTNMHLFEAEKAYLEAARLYQMVQDNIGLAYTYSELCMCYAKDGDKEKYSEFKKQCEKVLDLLPYENVKEYCIKKIQSAKQLLKL